MLGLGIPGLSMKQKEANPTSLDTLTTGATVSVWGSAVEEGLGKPGIPGHGGSGAGRLKSGSASSPGLFM